MLVHLRKSFSIEAAHRHPLAGWNGMPLHGHSFQIEVLFPGEINQSTGWVIDFADIKRPVKTVLDQLDHHDLNAVLQSPQASCAELADWIMLRLQPSLGKQIRVSVTCPDGPLFLPHPMEEDKNLMLPPRLSFGFEAAHLLPKVPEGHKCRRLHGHSYRIEVAAINLEDLLPALTHLHTLFDHHYLNELPGLENPTAEIIAVHIFDWLSAEKLNPYLVVVKETPESACILFKSDREKRLDNERVSE